MNISKLKVKAFSDILPGLLLSAAIAAIAWTAGKYIPVIGGPVISIILGMLFAFIPRNNFFSPGLRFSAKTNLQFAVILLGFEMNLQYVFRTGIESSAVMAVTVSAA